MSTRNDSNNDLNRKLFPFLIFIGAIFSMAAVLMLWAGIDDYTTQLNRVDWPITEAIVLNVEEKNERYHTPGGGTHTSYNIYYQYVVDGQMYDGNFEQAAEAEIGETIKIKYDPNDPGYSTGIGKCFEKETKAKQRLIIVLPKNIDNSDEMKKRCFFRLKEGTVWSTSVAWFESTVLHVPFSAT